ncbi:unnamed protein product [Rhizoctonia solani]|uniref:Uncharacterized protein n=1 Tax=Rhizoctonia solani TaxID=456999 RepID=A0A8H3C8U8_9AGAM|nr:unnamed protein product [Rhizoctonia solani]
MWDKAWDARWKVVWKRLGPVAHPHGNGRMQSIANITGNINIISAPVDGCAPGRTAGRAPVQLLPTESSSVLLSVIMAGSYGKYLRIPQHSPNETSKKQDESQDPDSTTNKHHALNEITTSYIHRVPVDERYNCAVNWLGNSLPLESNTYQVWATPRECAIESAWAAAWSAAETRGAATSKSVLAVENSGDGPQTYTLAGARPRARTSVHPGVLGAISVTKSVTRIAIRASQRLSISFNREHSQESPGMASSHAGDSMEASRRSLQNQSPLGAVAPSSEVNSLPLDIPHTSTRQKLLSEIETSSPLALYHQAEGSTLPSRIPRVRKSSGASSKQRKSDALTAGLHPISEASSRVDLSTPNPTVGSAGGILEPFPANAPVQMIAEKNLDSSVLSSGRTSPRPRSESATRRLRKHVITRWSDSQRYSEFEDAFVDKTQERKYREKKERSCAQAVQHMLSPTVFEEKLREANPTQQAQEAWDRAASLSGKTTFERKLKGLAQQEWEKIVDHRKRNSLTPLGDQPNDWENQFISAWERAWKESWAAAWAEVWRQSYKEAILRGVEFGVEEIFDDLDPKPKRRTYESLESSRPYSKLRESLLDNKSSLGSLEQIHQWMKELSYLSESLQYSVPTLRDECMEITVIKDKPKAPSGLMGRLGTTEVKTEPVRMSHYDLQEWLAEVYIFQKVHRDKQMYNLFLRGIAEVWDSVSEISSL